MSELSFMLHVGVSSSAKPMPQLPPSNNHHTPYFKAHHCSLSNELGCAFCAPNFDAPNLIAPPVFDLAPRLPDPAGRAGRGLLAAAPPAAAPETWLLPLLLLVRPTATPPPIGLLTLPDVVAPPKSNSISPQPSPSPAASQPPAAAAAAGTAVLLPPLLLRAAAGLLLLVGAAAAAGWDDMLSLLRRLRACKHSHEAAHSSRINAARLHEG